jgi:hypothetical protein
MYWRLHVNYPLFLSYFENRLEFSQQIFEKYSNFMKIRPVGAELFRADGRMDGHNESNTRISKFCENA